jgi:hypothetical protein
MWITFITANVFGAMAWVLQFGDDIYIVRVPDRMHVVFGSAWTPAMTVEATTKASGGGPGGNNAIGGYMPQGIIAYFDENKGKMILTWNPGRDKFRQLSA